MKHLKDYIKERLAEGKSYFTTESALEALSLSRNALLCSIYRLKSAGDLVSLARHFYYVLSPEQSALGCPPAEEFIPILMKYWGLEYYACLLTAAHYHGASHQKSQVFQVMTHKQLKPIECGRVRVDFIYKNKKDLNLARIQQITVKTGYLNISTPEATAMDLFIYQSASGSIHHKATVLTELIEVIDPEKLNMLAQLSKETAWIQRLGYVLECINPLDEAYRRQRESIRLLKKVVQERKPVYIPLIKWETKKYPRNKDWKIIENTEVESDI